MINKSLKEDDYIEISKNNNLEIALIKSVVEVESSGSGFNSMGTPTILFEGHKFHKFTNGKYTGDSRYENISYPKWTKKYYSVGKNTTERQKGEYERLQKASVLDLKAALMSTSWGMFQIMGFNYKEAGFNSVTDFVQAMECCESEHLKAFINFCKNKKRKNKSLLQHLREHNWTDFTITYNGTGQVQYYSEKLEKAYEKYS